MRAAAAAFKHFAAAGISVHAFDALGHGRSPELPKRGRHNIERFSDLTGDAEAFAAAALDAYPQPPPPAFIMGQSLGCAPLQHRSATLDLQSDGCDARAVSAAAW